MRLGERAEHGDDVRAGGQVGPGQVGTGRGAQRGERVEQGVEAEDSCRAARCRPR